MDTNLTQAYLAQRAAASHTVAGALAPTSAKSSGATSTARSVGDPAAASTTGTSTSADTSTSTITSDDFLTLLVNELKNQDPTQPTDPNEYITQLAQVNSLEQLIQINSGISQLDTSVPSTTTSTSPTTSSVSGTQPATSGVAAAAASSPALPLALALTSSAASQIHRPAQGIATH